MDALIPSQARHAECQAFLATMARARTTVVFNRFLEPELWEAAYKIALKELHPGRHTKDLRQDLRTLRRAKTLQAEVEGAWRAVLTALNWVSVELSEVEAWVPEMMRYGLASYDAIHAATAMYTDVHALVILDHHYASVPQKHLQLWVPESRLRPCRNRRRGRS